MVHTTDVTIHGDRHRLKLTPRESGCTILLYKRGWFRWSYQMGVETADSGSDVIDGLRALFEEYLTYHDTAQSRDERLLEDALNEVVDEFDEVERDS